MNRSTLALRQTLRLGNTVIGGKTTTSTRTFNLHTNAKILANLSKPPRTCTGCMDNISSSSLREFSSSSATIESDARAEARDEHLLTKTTDAKRMNESVGSDDNIERKPTRLRDVPISEVLKSKHTLRWVQPVINKHASVRKSIETCIENGLSGMMVVDESMKSTVDDSLIERSQTSLEKGKVVGMLTSRDLLRIIAASLKEDENAEDIFKKEVGKYMTPITQVIYARPEETIGTCRSIMAKLGVKCLPILKNGRVEGLVTARDMSDYGLDAAERGGKKHYLESVSQRVGLSSNTSMAEPPAYLRAHLALQQKPLFMNVGCDELPHPYKTAESCGISRRSYGPEEDSHDIELSEDAHFVTPVMLPDETGLEMREATYVGVADGVGSWREYGVDPREFSRTLMQECENILREAETSIRGKNIQKGDEKFRRHISPAEVMAQAYERVKAENIIGSSTACVAMFDGLRHQLHFSNLGDSGIIVLRHIDSTIAGTLKRDKTKRREERVSDLRIAFVSQQQLKSFNHPYQLGWTGEETDGEDTSFKNASESCTTSIHIRRGDIVLLATDGLFDNVELEDIASITLEWEERNGFIRDGDIASRDKRWEAGSSMTNQSAEVVSDLAEQLVQRARDNSVDRKVDSPFAILAKENDIMWSGGMPDDCTVIAMHIVGAQSSISE